MIPLARGIMSREHPDSCNVSTDDLIRTCSYFAEPYFIGMRGAEPKQSCDVALQLLGRVPLVTEGIGEELNMIRSGLGSAIRLTQSRRSSLPPSTELEEREV